ncbi:hypothetical protein FHS61_001631 [Altererythrobacter atlanticus]|uniref:Glyoxalase-like domain protein n=1 Tax=Croceibacterium atlanticum TaxID=1267766 RepID=A0A0F7KPS5_9SPHN|nr:VOC family protein [Croceibacterium atlanticum]AKH41107.1 Glyoxalase-like domain protein [Croceibacterium atlanticum]MBB5732622.1 hypothetical protein [Croceibacterium atlanticum]
MTKPAPLVFFDIAAFDLAAQRRFYSELFGWEIGEDGRFSIPAHDPVSASLRVEQPGAAPVAEKVLYFGVEDITAVQERAVELGGAVGFPRMVVPGVVILGMLVDPAGNRVGVVEISDGEVVVPSLPEG